jgi:uncharacterized protein (TIGR00255 family)
MRSMTGFGRATQEGGTIACTASVRTVNGRALDVVINLRGADPSLDLPLRELVATRFARGRVEIAVEIRPLGARAAALVDEAAVRELHYALAPLRDEGILAAGFSLADLLRLREGTSGAGSELLGPEEQQAVLVAARGALAQALGSRELEGAKLKTILDERLRELEAAVLEIANLRQEAQRELAEALRRRVAELLQPGVVDENRLAQEVVILADRSDVTEEIDRLLTHLAHLREALAAREPIGKRLDFLLQEVFRELNTLGAKCRHSGVTRRVVEAKVLAERLREQVQNIE